MRWWEGQAKGEWEGDILVHTINESDQLVTDQGTDHSHFSHRRPL